MVSDYREVEEILKELYPIQCEMVGDKLVDYVSQGGTEFAPPGEAHKNDYLEILKFLAAVASFAGGLISLRIQSQNLLVKRLQDELAALKATHSRLTEKEQQEIEERVLKS